MMSRIVLIVMVDSPRCLIDAMREHQVRKFADANRGPIDCTFDVSKAENL